MKKHDRLLNRFKIGNMNTWFFIGYLVIFIASAGILWNILRKDENADWPWILYLGGMVGWSLYMIILYIIKWF